ncbi:MAG: hypothetical protein KAU90_00135, partial [Sulfurovaceae bacterium]|nr:hypothetical protein [Sulfurovaceae bacterium]
KILMEIADKGKFNTGKHVTLPFTPKPIIKDKPQELSILQSLVDNGFLGDTEYQEVTEVAKARNVIDQILLENIFQNQQILEEHNLTTPIATIKNLEFIAEGLKELNVTELVENLDKCNQDNTTTSCEDVIIQTDDKTEINQKDAKIIKDSNSTKETTHTGTTEDNNKTIKVSDDGNVTVAPESDDNNTTTSSDDNNSSTTSDDNSSDNDSSDDSNDNGGYEPVVNNEKSEKNAADGYIIKLSSPATAKCYNSDFSAVIGTYNSNLDVGEKGKITFNAVTLNDHCSVTVSKGSIIDSNNNGQLDSDDKVLDFDMKSIGDTTYISPLTTLMLAKKEKGEDITELKAMVKDFDPVVSVSQVDSMSGTTQTETQKLLVLMAVVKSTLSDSGDLVDSIQDINISTVTHTAPGENFADFNIDSILTGIPENIAQKARAIANVLKRLTRLNRVIDKSIIDMSTLSVNISDGGLNVFEAFKKSVKASAPQSVKDEISSATSMESLIPNIIKDGYNPTQVHNIVGYFNEVSSNLSSIFGGYFDVTFGDINVSTFTRSRYFGFVNLDEIDKPYKVYSLDDITPDYYYNKLDSFNYDKRFEYTGSTDNTNIYKIVVNHPANFEIVDGLDSQYFDISQGNRQVAYIDLKDGIESPTEQKIYRVKIKATDVQTFDSKNIVLKFDTTSPSSPSSP